MESSPGTITVHVKFAGRTIPVEVPPAVSTAELKRLLQQLINVLPRGQRLICKGKVLADAASLSSLQLVRHHQGDGPITKNTGGPAPSARRTSNVKESQTQKPEAIISKSRSERWKLTDVIALSDSSLKGGGMGRIRRTSAAETSEAAGLRAGSSGVFDEGADDDNRRA